MYKRKRPIWILAGLEQTWTFLFSDKKIKKKQQAFKFSKSEEGQYPIDVIK